jgi:hypothetical protein
MVLENPTLSKKHKEDLVKAITTRGSLIELGITNAVVEQDRRLARQSREKGALGKLKDIRNRVRAHFTPKGNVGRLELLELSHVLDNEVELDPVAKKRVLNTIEHVVAVKNAKALGLKTEQAIVDEITELFGEFKEEVPEIDVEDIPDTITFQKYDNRSEFERTGIFDKDVEVGQSPLLGEGLWNHESSPYEKSLANLSNQYLDYLIDMLEYSKGDTAIYKLYCCYNEKARRELVGKGIYEGDLTNPFIVSGTKLTPLEGYTKEQLQTEFGNNPEMSPDGSMIKYGEEWYTFKVGYDENGTEFDITLTTGDGEEYRLIPSDEEFAPIIAAINTHKILESLNPTSVNKEDVRALIETIEAELEGMSTVEITQALSNINSAINTLDGELEWSHNKGDKPTSDALIDLIRECMESRNNILDHLAKFKSNQYKLPLPNIKYEPLIKLNYDAATDAREAAIEHTETVSGQDSERKVRDIKFTDEQQARIDEFETQLEDLVEALENSYGLANTIKGMLAGLDVQDLNLSDLVKVGLITQEERELLNEIPKAKITPSNSLDSIVNLDTTGLAKEDNKGKFLNTHDAKVGPEKKAALEDWLDTINMEDYQLEFFEDMNSTSAWNFAKKLEEYYNYENTPGKNPLDFPIVVSITDKNGNTVTHKGVTLEGFPFGKELRVVNDTKDKSGYLRNVKTFDELRKAKYQIAKQLASGGRVISSFKLGNPTLRTDKIDKKNVFEVLGEGLDQGHKLFIRGGWGNDFEWITPGLEALSLSENSSGGFTYVSVKGENGKSYPVRLNYSKVTEPKAQLLFYIYWKMANSKMDEFSLTHIVDSSFYKDLPAHLSGLKDSYLGMTVADLISMLALTGEMTAGKNSHIEYSKGIIANDLSITLDELKTAVKDNLYRQYEEAFTAQVMKAYSPVYEKFLNKTVSESGLHQGVPLVIDSITFDANTNYNDIVVHEEIGVLSTNAAPIGKSLFEKGFIEPYGAQYVRSSPTPVVTDDLPDIDITTDPKALTIPDLQAKVKGLESSINSKLGDPDTLKVREEIKTLQEILDQKKAEATKAKEAKPKKAKKEKPVVQAPPAVVDESTPFMTDEVQDVEEITIKVKDDSELFSTTSEPLTRSDISKMIEDNIIREDCK